MQTVPFPTPASTGSNAPPITLPLPSAPNGIGAQVALPAAGAQIPPNTTVKETTTDVAPQGIPLLSLVTRPAPLAVRPFAASISALDYYVFDFSQTVVFASHPSFTINFAPGTLPQSSDFYMAYYDPTVPGAAWNLGFDGPGVVSGNTVQINGANAPLTFAGGYNYYFALYSVPQSQPQPSVAPAAPIVPSPSSLSFLQAGASATINVTRTGYSGTFNAVTTTSGVVTVTAAAGNSFTVTAVAAGTTNIVISDSLLETVSIPVSVTITTGTIK